MKSLYSHKINVEYQDVEVCYQLCFVSILKAPHHPSLLLPFNAATTMAFLCCTGEYYAKLLYMR